MLFSAHLVEKAKSLLETLERNHVMLATAESCTGGLIAALFTEIPGSSNVFERGFVTYSNEAKQSMLGVPKALLEKYGAVSSEVAIAMAKGAVKNSRAKLAISVTGIAGPGGGTADKPVGLVYIAIAGYKEAVDKCNFTGTRNDIRFAAVDKALDMLNTAVYTHLNKQ